MLVFRKSKLIKTEKSETNCEAHGFRIKIEKLEMTFIALVWVFYTL